MNPSSYTAKKSQIQASAIFQIKETKADLLSSRTFGILAPSSEGRMWDKFRTGEWSCGWNSGEWGSGGTGGWGNNSER